MPGLQTEDHYSRLDPAPVADPPAPIPPPRILPTVRDLPPEEWARLAAFEPFASLGLPPAASSRIIVAEQEGTIVAFWGLFTAVHVEPLWIHPDHRRRPGLARRLWRGVTAALGEAGVRTAFACLTDAEAAANVPLALRHGFSRFPGDLYVLQVAPAPPEA